MSSRSLAAARAKRAGESAPPVSGNRPGTSIGSHAAFAPQQQTAPSYNNNMQPNNVRTGRAAPQQQQQNKVYQDIPQSQQQTKKDKPFNKITVSDAIGLITIRLGRVEQWIIDTENDTENSESHTLNLPENSKIIDSSILNNFVSRLDSLEKKEPGTVNSEEILKLSESVTKLTEQITRIGDEGIKQSLIISKHTEQIFKFDRDLVETKDLLKTFMMKYDMFANDTNNKFSDYELALSELEKNVQIDNIPDTVVEDTVVKETVVEDTVDDEGIDINDIDTSDVSNTIMSFDLKNIIKQELASSN